MYPRAVWCMIWMRDPKSDLDATKMVPGTPKSTAQGWRKIGDRHQWNLQNGNTPLSNLRKNQTNWTCFTFWSDTEFLYVLILLLITTTTTTTTTMTTTTTTTSTHFSDENGYSYWRIQPPFQPRAAEMANGLHPRHVIGSSVCLGTRTRSNAEQGAMAWCPGRRGRALNGDRITTLI